MATETKIGIRYAQALVSLAKERNELDAVFADMQSFGAAYSVSEDLRTMLNSPVIKFDKKLSVLETVFGSHFSPLTKIFIEKIARKLPLERIAFNDGLANFWTQLVHDYTACDLTNPTDKLIALSGVAKALQRSIQHEYFAGLWNTHLPTQLLWQQGSAAHPLKPATTYRAPSWSWASVDERIVFPKPGREVHVKILDISVEPAGLDRTAAVKGGTLRLKGLLATIELDEIVKYATFSTYSMQFRTPSNEWRRTTSCRPSLLVPPKDLHCLVIQEDSTTGFDCLLLVPTGSARGQFYRWGIVSIDAEEKRELHFHDDFVGEPHEWFQFEKSHGNGIYTVSIV